MVTLILRIWNYLKVKSATKTADKLAKVTRKRHYVIQVKNKIRVFNKTHIDYLIHKKVLHPKLKNFIELQKFSIYFTK